MAYPILCVAVVALVLLIMAFLDRLETMIERNAAAGADEAEAEEVVVEEVVDEDDMESPNARQTSGEVPVAVSVADDPTWQGRTVMTVRGQIYTIRDGEVLQYGFGEWKPNPSRAPRPAELRMGLDLTGIHLPEEEAKAAELARQFLWDLYYDDKHRRQLEERWKESPTLQQMLDVAYWFSI